MKRKMFAKDMALCRGLRFGGITAVALSVAALTNVALAQSTAPPVPAFVRVDLFQPNSVTFNQLQVSTNLDQILSHGVPVTQAGSLSVVPVVLPQDDLPIFIRSQVLLSLRGTPNTPLFRAQAVQLVLDQLAPNLYTDLPYLTFDNTWTVYSSLEQRTEELRFGAVTPVPQLEPTITGTSKDGKEIKNPVVPEPPPSQPKWATFAYLNGQFGTLNSDGNGFGFDYQAGGVVIGVDYRITDKVAVGIAGGYEYSNLDPKFVGGHGSANAGYGAMYTTYGGPTGLYAEAIGGVGYTSYAIQRDVLGTSAHGYPDAWDASAGGTLGYMIKLTNNLRFAPFGQLFYDNLWRSGASETGSIASLNVAHGSAETLDTIVGGKLVGSFYVAGIRLTNVLWAGYRHDYLQSVYSVSSSFLDGGFGSFVTHSPRISPDSVVAGAGINADLTQRFSVSLNYEAQANNDYLGNLFTLGLKYKF